MKRNGYRTKYHFVLQVKVAEGLIYHRKVSVNFKDYTGCHSNCQNIFTLHIHS